MTADRRNRLLPVRVALGAVLAFVLIGRSGDIASQALKLSQSVGYLGPDGGPLGYVGPHLLQAAIAAAGLIPAGIAIHGALGLLTRRLEGQAGVMVRNLTSWTIYLALGLWIAVESQVDLSGLVVGGAILGVVIAAASQASLSNFFAGLLLLFSQPYRVGAAVQLRGPALTGNFEGTVLDMGALYTTLATGSGEVVKVPNSAVISSSVVVGAAPLQAEVTVDLPPATALAPIEQALRSRLGAAVRSVTIQPRQLEVGRDGKLSCAVQVRSLSPVEPALLAEALAAAVATIEAPSPGR